MGRPARKLPMSRVIGGSAEFSITARDWKKVEAAYGCALSDAVHQSIVDKTNKFLASEVFERHAKPLTPAIKLIESVKATSDKLQGELSTKGGDAGVFAQSVIKQHFFSSRLRMEPYDQLFHVLVELTSSLSTACRQALAETDDLDATIFRDGASWDNWIRELTQIASQNGLPTAAPKAGSREADFGPFARLIAALQKHLPQEARRHTNSRLSAAIYAARNKPLETIEEL
jgi:hypothetical protein